MFNKQVIASTLSLLLTMAGQIGLAQANRPKVIGGLDRVNTVGLPGLSSVQKVEPAKGSMALPAGPVNAIGNTGSLKQAPMPAQNKKFQQGTPGSVMGGTAGDTGGGNVLPSGQVSLMDVSRALKKARILAPFVLNSMEMMTAAGQLEKTEANRNLRTLLYKIFQDNNKNMFTALREAKFYEKPDGPCFDGKGRAVAASAIKAPLYCFSLKMIAESTNSENVVAKVLQLLLHELAHSLETTDDEPALVQVIASAYKGNDLQSDVLTDLRKMKSTLQMLQENSLEFFRFQDRTNAVFQMSLSLLIQQAMRMTDVYFESAHRGYAIVSFNNLVKIMTLQTRLLNIVSAYLPGFSSAEKVKSFWQNRTSTDEVWSLYDIIWGPGYSGMAFFRSVEPVVIYSPYIEEGQQPEMINIKNDLAVLVKSVDESIFLLK